MPSTHPPTGAVGACGRVRLAFPGAASMTDRETDNLRVLIANERKDRLALVAPIVVALGHEVIAREIDVDDVGAGHRAGSDPTSPSSGSARAPITRSG